MPATQAKLKLLDAAERLVSERGFEAVSVRDVTQLAKANVAAVNYHFGSREQMMGLIIGRYLGPVNEERMARLGVLEKKWGSKGVALEELVEAYLRPLTVVATRGAVFEVWQCQLLGRILDLDPAAYPEVVRAAQQEVMGRYVKALAKPLSAVSKHELWWRLHFVTGGMIHLLIHGGGLARWSDGESGGYQVEQAVGRYLAFAVAGLREGMPSPKSGGKASPQATFDF